MNVILVGASENGFLLSRENFTQNVEYITGSSQK